MNVGEFDQRHASFKEVADIAYAHKKAFRDAGFDDDDASNMTYDFYKSLLDEASTK